jgi:hypothetical protein
MKGISLFGGGSDMPGGFVSPDMLKYILLQERIAIRDRCYIQPPV